MQKSFTGLTDLKDGFRTGVGGGQGAGGNGATCSFHLPLFSLR